MKKLFALFVLAFCLLLTGCDEEIEYVPTVGDVTPRQGYWYAIAQDCGDGCLYEKDGAWWYYNYDRRERVSLCSDPLCGHTKDTCFARIRANVYGYGGKLYTAATVDNDTDDFRERYDYVIREADIAAQTKREVLRLKNRAKSDAFAYGDTLFVGLREEYYHDGDYLYASSDRVRVYLMAVSLETMETRLMTECLADGFNTSLSIRGVENGKLVFTIRYYENRISDDKSDNEINPPIKKIMSCDVDTLEFAEYEKSSERQYLDGCSVYLDGSVVCFDRGGTISCLETHNEEKCLPYVEYYSDGKAYFHLIGNEGMLYKFDTDTEKLYVSSFTGMDDMKLIAERENDFAFINGENDIVMLKKDEQLAFTELDAERIKTMFENYVNSRFNEGMTEEELEEFLSSLLNEPLKTPTIL